MRRALPLLATALALTVAGCGGDDDDDSADRAPSATSTTSAPPPKGEGDKDDVSGKPLAKEIYPRCGVDLYGSPAVTPNSQFGGYRLSYTHPDAQDPVSTKGKTTGFNIEERPPDSTPVTYRQGSTVRIEGEQVDLVTVKGGFTAQWVTDRARYVVLGGPVNDGIVQKLVRCLP